MAENDDRGGIIIEEPVLKKGFVQVPVTVLHDDELSSGAKLAYATLLWYAWKDGEYPGDKQMAEDLSVSERSIRNYMADLKKRDWIRIEERGLGQTTTYFLPENNFRSDRKNSSGQGGNNLPVNNKTLDSVQDSNEKTKGALRLSFEDKTELIQHLHDRWDGENTPLQSRLTLLRPWSLEIIQQAAEITARAEPDEPFAYLYGILKRQPTPLAEQETEELSDEEFQAAREEIDRINEQQPWND